MESKGLLADYKTKVKGGCLDYMLLAVDVLKPNVESGFSQQIKNIVEEASKLLHYKPAHIVPRGYPSLLSGIDSVVEVEYNCPDYEDAIQNVMSIMPKPVPRNLILIGGMIGMGHFSAYYYLVKFGANEIHIPYDGTLADEKDVRNEFLFKNYLTPIRTNPSQIIVLDNEGNEHLFQESLPLVIFYPQWKDLKKFLLEHR